MGRVYNIPVSYGFSQALVTTLLRDYDRQSLGHMEIYLPTQRAVRTLQGVFRDVADGQALFLPRLYALGDLDADELALGSTEMIGFTALDLPPAMGTAQRLFLLSRLVDRAWDGLLGASQPKSQTQVFAYARTLATLLDTL